MSFLPIGLQRAVAAFLAIAIGGCSETSSTPDLGPAPDGRPDTTVDAAMVDAVPDAGADVAPTIDAASAFARYAPIVAENTLVVEARGIAAAADGSGYAVLWDGFLPGSADYRLFVSRLSPAGEPQGAPIALQTLSSGSLKRLRLFAAADGGYVIFYALYSSSSLWTARLDALGTPTGPERHNDLSYGNFDVAAGPNGFLAVYAHSATTTTQIFARPFDAQGAPSGDEKQVEDAPEIQNNPRVAWANGAYAVTWRGPTTGLLRLARLDETGALQGPSTEPVSGTTAQYDPWPSALGGDALCIFYEYGDLWRAQAFDAAGQSLWDPVTQPLDLIQTRFESVNFGWANSPGGLGIAWENDRRSVVTQIAFAVIDRDAGVPAESAGQLLTEVSFYHFRPVVAWDGSRFAVVFAAEVEGTRGLFIRFVQGAQ